MLHNLETPEGVYKFPPGTTLCLRLARELNFWKLVKREQTDRRKKLLLWTPSPGALPSSLLSKVTKKGGGLYMYYT